MMFQLLKLLKIYGEKNEEGELMTTELPTMVTEHLSKVDWLDWIKLDWLDWVKLDWLEFKTKTTRNQLGACQRIS